MVSAWSIAWLSTFLVGSTAFVASPAPASGNGILARDSIQATTLPSMTIVTPPFPTSTSSQLDLEDYIDLANALALFEPDAFDPNRWHVTSTSQSTQPDAKAVAVTATVNQMTISMTTGYAMPTGLPFIDATYPTNQPRPNSNNSWHFHCAYEHNNETNQAANRAKLVVLNTDFPPCTLAKTNRYRAVRLDLWYNFGKVDVGATLQGPCPNATFKFGREQMWSYIPLVLDVCPGHDDAAHMGGRLRLGTFGDGSCFVDIGVYPSNQTVTGSTTAAGVVSTSSASRIAATASSKSSSFSQVASGGPMQSPSTVTNPVSQSSSTIASNQMTSGGPAQGPSTVSGTGSVSSSIIAPSQKTSGGPMQGQPTGTTAVSRSTSINASA